MKLAATGSRNIAADPTKSCDAGASLVMVGKAVVPQLSVRVHQEPWNSRHPGGIENLPRVYKSRGLHGRKRV